MPPKRKSKVTKAAAATPLKAPPAAMRTSSQAKRRNSSSLPGATMKTSRLLPSEPLHMKTRRAVKTASNQTSSGAPSIASSSSRRSSVDDLAQFEDAELDVEDERPAKRTRLSTDSGSPQLSTGSFIDSPAVNGTQTPDSPKTRLHSTSNGPKASTRKRRASDDSTQSSKTVSVARANGLLTRAESDISEQPHKKRRITTQLPAESADQPPELTDASTAPNSPEQIAEVEPSQSLHHVLPTNGDAPTKMGRRLPGRRRAPHSNINVEADLRRQLNLKMSYRSLAKIQKNILEELSNRATSELQNDPEYYKRCPEYEPLMASLDRYKASRLAQLTALRREKLEQEDRVLKASVHIEEQKYLQKFADLQEDLLLQCFHRMKKLEREMKGVDGASTEDEDNIIAPTHGFPVLGNDDRLGSKFASRSRAYVETERLLDEEVRKHRFKQGLRAFIAQDEDADNSIDTSVTKFASFTGPDRTEAVAHWNIKSLIDAAHNLENQPVLPEAPEIKPDGQADALLLLASLSASAPRNTVLKEEEQLPELSAPVAHNDPQTSQVGLRREITPDQTSGTAPPDTFTDIDDASEVPSQVQGVSRQQTPLLQTTNVPSANELHVSKNETPARSTHRIMDMLNNDSDFSHSRPRDPQAYFADHTPVGTPSRQTGSDQTTGPSENGLSGLGTILHPHDPHPMPHPAPPKEVYPSLMIPRTWPEVPTKVPSYSRPISYEELRRKDPLLRFRDMMEGKAAVDGKIPSGQRSDTLDNARRVASERERSEVTVPPLARPFSPSSTSDKQDKGKASLRTSNIYNASPSAAPLSYQQSPSIAPAYLPPGQSSQDPGSQWDRDRRLSGSQQSSQQPYNETPPQYPAEHSKTAPPHHQSPFSAPSVPPQLPPISQTLPPKPAGSTHSNPISYRFAHYDPAPPRTTYSQPHQSTYPPASRPSPHGTRATPYVSGYSSSPSYQGGYIPPPGSFQAPPPPPTASSPYPPLKIHQYGGQPILPANMARPLHSQPYPNQPSHPQAYSPPQQHQAPPHNPSYDANAPPPPAPPQEPSSERSADGPQSRQRRPYRSYHAPGTQFRSYTGPESTRRRGG